ncbi:hypothetical protein [Mangrovactinospora gilvigrisea]|nr:hypothetical protein [Mangrovactinospora gilvigrisea]
MLLIEIVVPMGDTRRDHELVALGRRIIDEIVQEETAPRAVLDRTKALSRVVFHRPAVSVTGAPGDGPAHRWSVRITLPHDWMPGAGIFVKRISRLLGKDGVWVYVVPAAEGGLGAEGRLLSQSALTSLITEPYRSAGHRPEPGIDPVCGMAVPQAATLALRFEELDLGFCSEACLLLFAEEHGLPARPAEMQVPET